MADAAAPLLMPRGLLPVMLTPFSADGSTVDYPGAPRPPPRPVREANGRGCRSRAKPPTAAAATALLPLSERAASPPRAHAGARLTLARRPPRSRLRDVAWRSTWPHPGARPLAPDCVALPGASTWQR